MNDIKILRDHSLPCEHDEAWRENLDWFVWKCGIEVCPGGKEIILTVMTDEVWVSVASDNPEFVVMDEYREVVCDSVAPAPVPTYYEVDGND